MSKIYITAQEYQDRRQKLQQQLSEAQANFNATLEQDEDGKVTRDARWNVEHLELRIEALDRLRQKSVTEEQQQAEVDRLERQKQQAANIHDLAAIAEAKSKAAEEALQAFLADIAEANSAWLAFAGAVTSLAYDRLGSEHPRLQAITMALGHRFEGPTIVGRLQKAQVPGLDLVDDPIDAMRQAGDNTLGGLVQSRINTVLRQTAIDIPELDSDTRQRAQAEQAVPGTI